MRALRFQTRYTPTHVIATAMEVIERANIAGPSSTGPQMTEPCYKTTQPDFISESNT